MRLLNNWVDKILADDSQERNRTLCFDCSKNNRSGYLKLIRLKSGQYTCENCKVEFVKK